MNSMFFMECRQTVKSVIYLIYIAVIILFFYFQISPELVKIEKPRQDLKSYGIKYQENPEVIMPNAVKNLYRELRKIPIQHILWAFIKR
jgi:hypothetical protein